MKFSERNNMLQEMNKRYATVHDSYTSNARMLSDTDWEEYVSKMDEIAAEFKDTNMKDFSGALCMAYLNDTEFVQKKLKEVKKVEV